MASTGFSRDNVDIVLCTHLHIDHVGWNTMLDKGRWVPTFPNARYLVGKTEYAYSTSDDERLALFAAPMVLQESVKPLRDTGLLDLVETDHRLSPELRLVPTPGHTPGHVSLIIESEGECGVITGDMMHHPSQIPYPQWRNQYDTDPTGAITTRERMLTEWEAKDALVIGTHFAPPTAGRIRREGDMRRFKCVDDEP